MSNLIVTREAAEVENEQPPPELASEAMSQLVQRERTVSQSKAHPRDAARTATRPHRPIDVVTIEPQPEASPDAPEAAFSSVNRVRNILSSNLYLPRWELFFLNCVCINVWPFRRIE